MTALSNAEKCRQSADNLLRRLTVQLTYSQHIPLTLHQNTMNRALQTSSDSLPFYSNDTVICRYMKFQLWLFFFYQPMIQKHRNFELWLFNRRYQLQKKSINTPSCTNSGFIRETLQNLQNFLLPDSSLFASSLHSFISHDLSECFHPLLFEIILDFWCC